MPDDDLPPQFPVAIVGAGPVGLALALGLSRHGVRSLLVERKPATNEQSRAPAIHMRTLEILRQWDRGVARSLLAAGTLKRSLSLYPGPTSDEPLLTFPFGDLDEEADHAGVLFLEQGRTERILLDAVRATGRCDVRFDTDVVGLEQGEEGVALTLRHGDAEQRLAAAYVVGCDGTTSFVRDAIGFSFEGVTFPIRPTLADVRITDRRDERPWPRFHNGRNGFTGAQRLAPQHWRIIHVEGGDPAPGEEAPEHELRTRVAEVLGTGPFEVLWSSRFVFQRRHARRYRKDRVLLAGDAAHAFPPANGQGMNAGIQDAHNLAWKLAIALRGGHVERLLESYDIERREVVGTVSQRVALLTRVGIQAPRAVKAAVFQLMRLAMNIGVARRERVRNMAMLDLELPASPLLEPDDAAAGVRLPDPTLTSPAGEPVRLYDLLPPGPALLDLDGDDSPRAALPVDTTITIGAGGHRDPSGQLRDLLPAQRGWIFVRPDLHVAWARAETAGMGGAVAHALGR